MITRPLTLVLLLIALVACGGRVTPPTDFSSDPARYHAAFDERRSQVKALSGELALEIWEGDQRVRARQLFATIPPHRLRVDTLSPFEQPVSTLIINEQQLALHELDQRRFRVGEPTADHLGKLSRIHLDPTALATVLSGQPPLIQSAGGVVSWDDQRGLYLLTLTSAGSPIADREELWLSPRDLTVVEVRLYRAGELDLRLQLTDYTTHEPKLPRRMRFELPQRKVRVEVKLKDFALNPDLPEEAFVIISPFGISPEPL